MTNFVITLKWVLLVITLLRVNADDTHGIEKRDTSGEAKKVVCYYTNWSVYRQGTAKFTPLNINPYLCTHLIYAFGGLDKENDGLRPFDSYQDIEQGGYTKFTGLKTYNKNLKTMIAIGGWNEGSSRFSKLVADEDRRSTFVKNVIKFLRQNNFDGLDLDWEYPAFRDGSKSADRENYATLVKELREEFERESSKTGRPRLLLTMAVPAGIEYIDKGYDVPKLNKYLDFLNILSYDYYSVYEPKVNHHAPLYTLREPTEYDYDSQLSIDETIKHYLKKGADQEKLVLGIPTYGRSFTLLNPESSDVNSQAEGPGKKGEATKEKGYLAYYEICSSVTKEGWTVVHPNKSAMGPYAYHENQWVGYDDMDSVKMKSKYVNDKNLGGIMFWAIDIDDFRGKCHGKPYPLIEAGKEALLSGNGGKSSNSINAVGKKPSKLGPRKDRPKELALASVKHRTVTTVEPPTDSETAEDVAGRQSAEGDAKKLVCYHTNWSSGRSGTGRFMPETLSPHLCTHLIYAFAAPDIENNTIVPTDEAEDVERGGYAKFTGLKNKNKNLKTLLAVGGWNEGSTRFSKLVASKSKRTAFAKNAIKFLRQNSFDGLDINWQYPTFRNGNADDKENFASLIKEIKDEFMRDSSKTGKQRLLLSISVPAGINYINNGFDITKLNRYVDFMNVLAYDYHSGSDPNVYHHSPLYSLPDQSLYESELTINYTIHYLMKNGANPEKLVLGIPTYGRSYTLLDTDNTDLGSAASGRGQQGKYTKENGYLAYYEICSNLESNGWTVVHPNKSAMGPYAYRENQWIGYDDAESVKLKAKYALSKGLGGIMFWAADIDDFKGECHNKPYPLIEAGKEVLFDSSEKTVDQENIISAESSRPKKSSTTTTTPSSFTLSTPEPPTTPDTGADFTCEEDGFFPHPRDCKKYFWCLDSGPSNLGIVAHQFTCPAGLMFNKATDSCDYSRNVVCSKKSSEKTTTSTTTTTTPKSRTTTSGSRYSSTTTSTTTTTTTQAPEEEEEEEGEENVEEDPKAIKQLITLIKKLGGINELERQLKIDEGSKEATTPAISRNLYNKVFSTPGSNRFRNQHRNAPSGPQNEGLSTTDDVPYRKDKPQYVTIQRTRPQKSFVADAEDSGTTNNKAVRPNKDTTEYVDSVEEEDVTTTKYSSPRSRTTQKYVVLERHRPEKASTTEEEELSEAELPSSTTQRYITLVRNRPSTTANEIEDLITETSTQRATRPAFRTTTTESTTTDKPKEKVSETATTTAQTLSVTSAQYVTTSQVQSSDAASNSTTTSEPTTEHSRPYIVFAQALDENSTTASANTTEALLTSTTVITTVRESATEKTRIPLKMYREFVKKNRTDHTHDLATNLVHEPSKTDIRGASPASAKTKSSAEIRYAFLRGRRLGLATTPLTSTNQTDSVSAEQSGVHSRFIAARRKSHLNATALPEAESMIHEETVTTTHRYNRLRPTSAESSIDNFFKRRRASTTSEKALESPSSTSHTFTRGNSRYFSKSKKSDEDTSTESLSTTHKSRFSKDKFRDYRIKSQEKSTTSREVGTTFSDQVSQSNSNEEEIELEQTDKPDSYHRSTTRAETTTRKYANADHFRQRNHYSNSTTPVTTSTTLENSTSKSAVVDHFRHWARTTEVSASTTHRPSAVDHFRHNTLQTQTTIADDRIPLQAENTRNVEERYVPSPRTESTPVSETYSRINPRNNSRFLKNPEPAYRYQEQKQKDPFRIHVTLGPSSPKPSNSPLFIIQRTNETGFEVQIRHGNEAARSRDKSTGAPAPALQRGRKKFSDSVLEEAGNTAAYVVADQRGSLGQLEARRSRPAATTTTTTTTTTRSYPEETAARKATTPTSRGRGSIKAQTSLSKAEIKELANSVDTSLKKGSSSRQHRPINKIEETYYDVSPRFTPRHRVEPSFVPLAHTDNFSYSKLYTLPNELNDRYDPEPSFNYYFFNNALQTEPSEVDPALKDSLRVSETRNLNEGARELFAARQKSSSPDTPSTPAATASSSESSSRIRGNFRRTSSPQRSRSSTSTTTSTEYTPTESNKLSSRFRRRKGRPENRSINTARDENFIPLAEVESSTVNRHKNYDISHRGTALVSDYLPVPAPLYRVNQTSNGDQLNGANLNLEDLDAQIIVPPTGNKNYDSDDVSDLANPAVAAITNLKTMPPASSYTKMVTARPSTIVTYPSAPKIEYHSPVLATIRTTALPTYVPTISPRRGSTKISGRTTTTTQIPPSLQDIYNDYQEDLEYHAEPVEIPITGKVRIHSDGYIECLDMGNFPHPFSCRKFISCAKMEYDTLLGWEYTCPKGLSFDPIGGICNWSAGLGCKD